MISWKSIPIKSKGSELTKLTAFVVFALISFVSQVAALEVTSVAVVNVTFLMENAPQSEAASNLLKEKFLPQEESLAKELEEINTLESELAELGSQEPKSELKRIKERKLRSRKRQRSRSLQDFREELRFARDAALDDVQKEVFKAIDEVRDQQEIDIVLQTYVSVSKRADITPLVLEYLKKQLEPNSKVSKEK